MSNEDNHQRQAQQVWRLMIASAALMIGTIGSTLAEKRLSIAIAKYPFALTQLSPLSGIVAYGAITFALTMIHRHFASQQVQREESVGSNGEVSSPKLAPMEVNEKMADEFHFAKVNWWLLAAQIACCFSLHNVLNNVGNRGNVIPGPVVLILSKLVVPVSLVFEGTERDRLKYKIVGILLLFAGTAIGTSSLFQSFGAHETAFDIALRIGLIALSNIPLAGGLMIWRNKVKKYARISVPQFWMSLCVCQVVIGFVLIYLNAWLQEISAQTAWQNFADGMYCIFNAKNPVGDEDSECRIAPFLWFVLDLPMGCIFNISMATIAKDPEAGPTIVWVLRTVALPISGILFNSYALFGKYATEFTVWELGSLAVVLIGLIVYMWAEIYAVRILLFSKKGYADMSKQEQEPEETKTAIE
jgi:hypothetical protein